MFCKLLEKQGGTQSFQAPALRVVCTDICLNYFSILLEICRNHYSGDRMTLLMLLWFPYYISKKLFYQSICIIPPWKLWCWKKECKLDVFTVFWQKLRKKIEMYMCFISLKYRNIFFVVVATLSSAVLCVARVIQMFYAKLAPDTGTIC